MAGLSGHTAKNRRPGRVEGPFGQHFIRPPGKLNFKRSISKFSTESFPVEATFDSSGLTQDNQTEECTLCGNQDSMPHFFVEGSTGKSFWQTIFGWWRTSALRIHPSKTFFLVFHKLPPRPRRSTSFSQRLNLISAGSVSSITVGGRSYNGSENFELRGKRDLY